MCTAYFARDWRASRLYCECHSGHPNQHWPAFRLLLTTGERATRTRLSQLWEFSGHHSWPQSEQLRTPASAGSSHPNRRFFDEMPHRAHSPCPEWNLRTWVGDDLYGKARNGQVSAFGNAIPFGEYSTEWVSSRVDLAERTVELYRWLLRRHIGPTFGDVPIDDDRSSTRSRLACRRRPPTSDHGGQGLPALLFDHAHRCLRRDYREEPLPDPWCRCREGSRATDRDHRRGSCTGLSHAANLPYRRRAGRLVPTPARRGTRIATSRCGSRCGDSVGHDDQDDRNVGPHCLQRTEDASRASNCCHSTPYR